MGHLSAYIPLKINESIYAWATLGLIENLFSKQAILIGNDMKISQIWTKSALLFIKFIVKVSETGFIIDMVRREHTSIVTTPENIVAVAQSVRENLSTSTRHRSQELNISRISLHRILRKDLVMTLYKAQLVQKLMQNDHPVR